MVLHVKDDRTDWLVREFARRRGLGITEAIRTAVEEATERRRRFGQFEEALGTTRR
ncbi:MAG: type II toxin-antitoxin system VapB family antitoxin [Methylobacterium mesophilicum]|nr:type II toxin-antitoxin system VapB family antitoxin [Methylobacterium mesophilicum]